MIIFSIILVFAIIQKQGKEESEPVKTTSTQPKKKTPDLSEWDQYKRDDPKVDPNKYYPTPENGFSPYNAYFGKGIYNNNTNNSFKIKNSRTLSTLRNQK